MEDSQTRKPLSDAAKEAREEYIRKQAVVILRDLLISLR